jgi:hypothetical protein
MRDALLLFLIVGCCSVQAQQFPLKKIREIKLQPSVHHISVDRLGGFYTVGDCEIEQFDPEGKLLKRHKLNGCLITDLLEAWPLMRIYAYQRSKQQFSVFDHNLDFVEAIAIDPAFAVEPQLAVPTADLKSYWILDTDNSIKKIDRATSSVSLESDTLRNVKGKFTHMRDYQSMLFLLNEESGVYVINKLGKLVSTIPLQGVRYISFAGEDLYYLSDNRLNFYDIFSKDEYSVEIPKGNKFVVATDERLILIKDGKAEVFGFSPKK